MLMHFVLLSTALAADPTDLIYFVMVDRFSDGLVTNHDIFPDDPEAWHGGDLVGVSQRLPYLKEMGVTTIWLSPVFASRQVSVGGAGAYHGDWVDTLNTLEPRFGGAAAMDELVARAGEVDMSLVMDMVYNHVQPDASLRETSPGWFHPEQPIVDYDDPLQLRTGWVDGLPDLNQEADAVYHYLLGRSLYWASRTGIRNLRVDRLQHMSPAFTAQLSRDLRARLGEDLWMIGEDFQGDPILLAERAQEYGLDALFDFPLYYAMIDVFCYDGHPGQLADVLSQDFRYPDRVQRVTFLDSPDLPRLASECQGDQRRIEQALLFLFTARGVPALTYGTEWMLNGADDPENRKDMIWPADDATPPLKEQITSFQRLRRTHLSGEQIGTSSFISLSRTLMGYARFFPNNRAVLIFINKKPEWQTVSGQEWWLEGARTRGYVTMGQGYPLTIKEELDKPMTASWRVPPRGISVVFLGSDREYVSWAYRGAELGYVRATIQARAPVPAGGRLVAVGSNRGMGDWDPQDAMALTRAGDVWRGQVVSPSNTVLSWKLAIVHPDGSVEYEPRDNRYRLPRLNETIKVRWGR